jgi:hypothetical protein
VADISVVGGDPLRHVGVLGEPKLVLDHGRRYRQRGRATSSMAIERAAVPPQLRYAAGVLPFASAERPRP